MMRGRKGSHIAVAGAIALVVVAQPAAAQICSGHAVAPGQTAIGLRGSFPSGGTSIGVEAARNWQNPLGVFASIDLRLSDEDDVDSQPTFGLGFAYEVTDFLPAVPAWLSACPVAALAVTTGNNVTQFSIPLGVGFGTTIGTGEGFQVMPYVIPQFVFLRVSTDDVSTSDNNFGIGFGALAKFPGVYGGVSFNKIFETGRDMDWTLRGGLVFPARL